MSHISSAVRVDPDDEYNPDILGIKPDTTGKVWSSVWCMF